MSFSTAQRITAMEPEDITVIFPALREQDGEKAPQTNFAAAFDESDIRLVEILQEEMRGHIQCVIAPRAQPAPPHEKTL